jgi:predicted esterase
VKVHEDRVIVSGLSAGGAASWDILQNNTYNKKIAAIIPISAAASGTPQYFPQYIQMPIWVANGGQDASPAPYTVDQLITAYRNLGGKIDQTFFPTLGHGVWNNFWATPGYLNIWALSTRQIHWCIFNEMNSAQCYCRCQTWRSCWF